MASETVDPIDCLLPPPFSGQYPESHLHGANAGYKSQVKSMGRERVTFKTLGHRIAYAAIQGERCLSKLKD